MSENKFVHFFNSLGEDIKKQLKDLVSEVKEEKFEDTPATPSYTEVPLPDGTVLKVTKLEVGGEVIVVTPEGEVPAPEGEMPLADGTILVIKKEGEKSVIAENKPAAEMKKDAPTQDAKFAAIEEKFAAYEVKTSEEIKKLNTEIEGLKLKLSQKSAQLKKTVEVLEAFAAVPTEEPIKKPSTSKVDKKDKMFESIFGKTNK